MKKQTAILLASSRAPELQNMIRANLSEQMVELDLLHDDLELFKGLAQRPYDLIIIEVKLLTQLTCSVIELKTVSPQTEILLLATADERSQAVVQLEQGAADYILLPVTASELTTKIRRILENQALKAQLISVDQLELAKDELLTLHQATQEISQTWQFDEALKIILTKAYRLTQAEIAKVYLTNHSGILSPDKYLTQTLPRHFRNDNALFHLAQQAGLTQKLICYQKIADTDLPEQGIQAALLIPLVSRDKLLAVLALGSERPFAFPANEVRWLSIFCDQAAIVIENARLFQDLSAAYIDLAQSREKILHSRNTLQVLFDGISDGIYILNQDLTINALNQVEAERQGYRVDELIGKNCLSLNWAKVAPELINRMKEALHTGLETTWISPENETEPYLKDREFRIYPIHNRLAHTEQVVVFAQDVSERRRWQASLFRSANLAAVGQLAGSVAHQINNPLTITMANSQLLLLEVEPESEIHELATGIFKAGGRIQSIIENLLEFSNQETYFFVETNLIDTIEGALALVIRSLKKAKIELIKDYQVKPKLSASVSHLKLVWMNLLLNARDAVLDCTAQPQVIISTAAVSEREVKVTITDNGSGITEKNLEQLFRPFFTTKPVGKALGLGLYSAHAIIERHRGQIKVYSQPNVATTFEVILPLDNPRDL